MRTFGRRAEMIPDDEPPLRVPGSKAAGFHSLWSSIMQVCQRIRAESASLARQVNAWVAARQPRKRLRHASRKSLAFLRAIPWQALPVGLGGLLLLLAIWKVPQWQAARWEGRIQEAKEIAKLENDTRTTLIQAIGGAVVLIGLWVAWHNMGLAAKNIQVTEETALRTFKNTREGQITDRFTKAIAQLGEDGATKLAIRLGGIYALERIAKDSERDHWPIMEILTAYVREHAPIPAKQASQEDALPHDPPRSTTPESGPKPATDIQAILTVVGRRTPTFRKREGQRLDLRLTDLRGVGLLGAHLERADLLGAHLEGANLLGAHLERALLKGARLEGADLRGTHLKGADLRGAHLKGANLLGAHLERANLLGTHLEGADLRHADLEGADLRHADLEIEQLADVRTLFQAKLDERLKEEVTGNYPHLLKAPQT
jgi:hypothetical protein